MAGGFLGGLADGLSSGIESAQKAKQQNFENQVTTEKLGILKAGEAREAEKFGLEKASMIKQQKMAAELADAAAKGGYSGVVDYYSRTNPAEAIKLQTAKSILDENLLKSEQTQVMTSKMKSEYLEKSYSVLGNFGKIILAEKDPAAQKHLYESALPAIKKLVPDAPDAWNDPKAPAMLQLALGQAIPANARFEAEAKAAEMKTGTGMAIQDHANIVNKFGAESPQAKQAAMAVTEKIQALAANKMNIIAKQVEQQQKGEDALRNDYLMLNKGYMTLTDNYQKLKTAMHQPNQAGDIALVYNYLKMLDPTSAVLPGEKATVENAGNLSDQGWGLYNRLLTDKGKMDPKLRKQFVERGELLYDASRKSHDLQKASFAEIVKNRGWNAKNVMPDLDTEQANRDKIQAKLRAAPDADLMSKHGADSKMQQFIQDFQKKNPSASPADAIRWKLHRDGVDPNPEQQQSPMRPGMPGAQMSNPPGDPAVGITGVRN